MKFLKFSVISLFGLSIASCLFFFTQKWFNINSYYSNLIGDGVALFLVYLFSWYFVFDHSRQNFKRKLLLNIVSKIIVIYFLSLLIWIYEQNFLNYTYLLFNKKITFEILLTIVKICFAPISLTMNYFAAYIIFEVYLKKKFINK